MTQYNTEQTDIYNAEYDFPIINNLNKDMLNNRLLCTFVDPQKVDSLVEELQNRYTILYNKMFVLDIVDRTNEVCLTYNIDHGNVTSIAENTILVHRNKFYNVLYSINSLNALIKKLNNGVLDNKYPINWQDYKNSILLTQNGEFHQLNTKINKIIEIK